MNKHIVIGLAILALSTSTAFAAKRHHHAMKPKATAAATTPAASPLLGGQPSASDKAMYMKNQRDSGIKAKK